MSQRTTVGLRSTLVSTTQQFPLGGLLEEATNEDAYGSRTWIYVYNDDAAAFVAGDIVSRDLATPEYHCIIVPVSTAPMTVVGVAQHGIAAGSYGFVLRKGIGAILSDGTTTADTAQVVSAGTAGYCTDVAGVTNESFAFATAADTGAATLVTCLINCRG